MTSDLTPIIVKKEGVSDDSYTIVQLYVQNGSKVKAGDLIYCFETSKTVIDVESPAEGFIYFDVVKNEEVTIGRTIAIITNEPKKSNKNWFKKEKGSKTGDTDEQITIKISKPAQRLIDLHKIDITVFKNASLITREDVENYIKKVHILSGTLLDTLSINDHDLAIYGGGGHAGMCIDMLRQTQSHTIIGILDDNLHIQKEILGVPVLGITRDIDILISKGLKNVILGVGAVLSSGLRKKLFNYLKSKNLNLPNLIHPSASVEPSVVLGEGNQVMQGAIIGSQVTIGNNCIINSGSIISHDTIIGNNVHIAPGAIIAGGVTIKDDTIIGMGCTIFLGLTIGQNVIIQNGVNVFKNIEDNKQVQKDTTV